MVEIERYQRIGICLDVPHEGLLRVTALQQGQLNRQNSLDLADFLFHQCGGQFVPLKERCLVCRSHKANVECSKMACLPQSAFAVHKLRKAQNDKDLAVARLSTEKQDVPRYMTNTLDLSPVKYSDKLMNSIWGLYNRYSPHNFKKNNGSEQQYFGMQQPFAVACAASEKPNSEAKNCPNKMLPNLFGATFGEP